MKTLKLNLSDEAHEELGNRASQDHQSVNDFALRKLEELARDLGGFQRA
jgi:predicted HicB family RNase H-like nuclease